VFNGGYRWLFGHYLIQSYEGLVFRALVLVGVIPYSWFALKKVYAENAWLTLIKTALVLAFVIYLRRWGIGLTYYLTYLTI